MYKEALAWKTMRIMVVDDEEFCIAAMKTMCQQFGISVSNHIDFCFNGQEAIDTVMQAYEIGI